MLSGRVLTSILPREIEHETDTVEVFLGHLRMLNGPLLGPSVNSRNCYSILSSVSYTYLLGGRILHQRSRDERVGYSAKTVSRMVGEIFGDR